MSEIGGSDTPVALLIYRRPALTKRMLEAIGRARPKHLLVIADGPAPGQPDDERLCREARAALGLVNWPCRVETQFASVNLGLKRRVVSGLDWVFSKVPEAIILEDDCIPDPSFFPFCAELLARYRDEERVHMIRGGNFLRGRRYDPSSYYFSRLFHIWGWATWARAWKHYDAGMTQWPERRDNGWLEGLLPTPRMASVVRELFDLTYAGHPSAWDFQWTYSSWLRNAVAIAPWGNLVTNVGFGSHGTTIKDPSHWYARLGAGSVQFPLSHPSSTGIKDVADRREWDNAFPDMRALRNLPLRVESRLRRALAHVFPPREL